MAKARSGGERRTARSGRVLLCSLVLLLSVLSAGFLCFRLVSQLHYRTAVNHLRNGDVRTALHDLERAVRYLESDPDVWKSFGEAYHRMGLFRPAGTAFRFTEKAKYAYLMAFRRSPRDAEAAYGLARESARLRYLYSYLHPGEKKNPYDAAPYFREAIRLRPNGILYHYDFARYLYRCRRQRDLLRVVTRLARIYPPVYGYLKKEPFWSPEVREAVRTGFLQAVERGIPLHSAHEALAAFFSDEKDWAAAVSHYEKAMALKTGENSADEYLRLGELYLAAGREGEAERSFLSALSMSEDREKAFETIYGMFRGRGYGEEGAAFFEAARKRFPDSPSVRILLGRALMDLGRYVRARRVLEELNREAPTAEAFYWLARIAEKEKDWDLMEISIQKATVLDPGNSGYHGMFSDVLRRLHKLDRAEKEAGLAIRCADRPYSELFARRASILWRKKEYRAALADWRRAAAAEPGRARFHARAAEALFRLGEVSEALDEYRSAMRMDPVNRAYRKRYEEILAHPAGAK